MYIIVHLSTLKYIIRFQPVKTDLQLSTSWKNFKNIWTMLQLVTRNVIIIYMYNCPSPFFVTFITVKSLNLSNGKDFLVDHMIYCAESYKRNDYLRLVGVGPYI